MIYGLLPGKNQIFFYNQELIVKTKSETKWNYFFFPIFVGFFHKSGTTPYYLQTSYLNFRVIGYCGIFKKMNILAFETYLAGFLVAAYGKDHYLNLFLHCTQVNFASFEFESCFKKVYFFLLTWVFYGSL